MNQQVSMQRRQVYGPDPAKAYGGLTAQQYGYCELRAAGVNKSEAYRQAYSSEASDEALIHLAYTTEAKIHIADTINQMVLARQPETSLVPQVTKDFVLQGIVAIATKDLARDNVRLRAYELLGKAVGLFKDEAPPLEKPRTIEEIDTELKARLSSMLTVEGKATRVQPASHEPDNHQPAQSTGDRRRKPKV